MPLVDVSLYVMTPEFGAASQLEKIDMLDFADFVAINKFDRKGAADALRDVASSSSATARRSADQPDEMPVFGTMATRFNDDGVTALYQALVARLGQSGLEAEAGRAAASCRRRQSTAQHAIVPPARTRYLAEIAETVRGYHRWADAQAIAQTPALRARACRRSLRATARCCDVDNAETTPGRSRGRRASAIDALIADREAQLDAAREEAARHVAADEGAPTRGDEYVVKIRGKEIRTALTTTSLSGTKMRKVALPRYEDHGEILRWLLLENVPGSFPFTAGVFAFKRENEDPTRMFAGEGDAFRTNRRFHLLGRGMPAKRLSTAFDSVTLYGNDPTLRPDIYGKVGNSGVSIATLDDMKVLYAGFDLCAPNTSVSMTINGPAPTILAMFMNTAIDQQLDKFRTDNGREPTDDEAAQDPRLDARDGARHGAGGHPEGGPGPEHLHLLAPSSR